MIFKDLQDQEFFVTIYIVYIDEISSFLSDVTHNETFGGKWKVCYQILMKIIINYHKLILSDAKITDNAFSFIRTRKLKNSKTIIIDNTFKK